MASREQGIISVALESIPPQQDARLVGFAMMAEWEQPDGQRLLTRLIGDGGNPWQAKGYFHDGLTIRWPEAETEAEHHNPGHPPGWMRVS
jgi:hypothetical protein